MTVELCGKRAVCGALALGLLCLFGCSTPDRVCPTLGVLTPADGGTVDRALVTVSAVAWDERGMSRVEFFIDGRLSGTATTGHGDTFRFEWDTREYAELETHTVRVRAWDEADNLATVTNMVTVRSGVNGPTYHSGGIASDTWRATGNPHIVIGDVSLEQGATLVVLPGCYVSFLHTGLRAGTRSGSAIVAEGKPDSTIIFTSGATTPQAGDWLGIGVESLATDSTRFRYCRIDYAGEDGWALYVGRSEVSIRDCTIRYSGAVGIEFGCDRVGEFTGNLIDSCGDYPIRLRAEAVATLDLAGCALRRAPDGLAVLGGWIRRSGTWQDFGVPYVLQGSVGIGSEDIRPVLTIAPGVTVKVGSDNEFSCGFGAGTLICEGRAESPIVFTAASESPQPGDWAGISLERDCTPGTRFRFCTIEYGDCGLRIEAPAVGIRDCVIRFCVNQGVMAWGGLTEFCGNTVTNCGDMPLSMSARDLPAVGADNVLTGNGRDCIAVDDEEVRCSGYWVDPGVPYLFALGIKIGDNVTRPVVMIAPGAALLCAGRISVGESEAGGLIADGTADRILFTGCTDPPRPGTWNGIAFGPYAISEQCILRGCRIEYGGGSERGNVRIDGCLPLVVGDSIGHSASVGIRLAGSPVPDTAMLRADNTLYDNARGDFGN